MISKAQIPGLLHEGLQKQRGGDLDGAERLYREILAADDRNADAWNMLAAVSHARERLDEAAGAAQRATELRPKIAPYWLMRGAIETARGRVREAQSAYRRAIAIAPEFAEAHYALGRSCHEEGRYSDAIAAYRQALRRVPGIAEIRHALAGALLASDRIAEALTEYQAAFEADPQAKLDRRVCFERFNTLRFDSLPPFWRGEIERFFARDDIDRSRYALAVVHALMARPAFLAACTSGELETQRVLDAVVPDALFGALLRESLICDAAMERFLTRLRARLLSDAELRSRTPLDFLCTLALQCFNNEFIYALSEEEEVQAASTEQSIRVQLASASEADDSLMRAVATVAMYRPLHAANWIDRLLALSTPSGPLELLLRRTVREPREETILRAGIASLAPIVDAVSQEVRLQYEANPYPRWLSLERRPPLPAAKWLAAGMLGRSGESAIASPPKVLIAGCGTGRDALSLALEIAQAQVTAVDLSLSSLAYAKRKARELGASNLAFLQADILQLRGLAERFDIVCCYGVLHHMREPAAGLSVLRDLAQPGGFVLIGLYSALARSAVNAARATIARSNLAAVAASIREFRREVFAADPGSPLKPLLGLGDFYAMSECRDLVFHVQEHQYRLPQLARMLEEHGLKVIGVSSAVPPHAAAEYRKMFPEDAAMADLERWDAVEARHPDAFIAMYQVWCQRPG